MAGWADAKWKSPYISEYDHPDRVILMMPTVSLLSDEIIERLQEIFGDKVTEISRDKLLTLATCCTEETVSNDRLQQVIDRHSADITKLLKELCRDGYIIPKGNGRGTKYYLNMDFGSRSGVSEKVGSFGEKVGSSQRRWLTREQLEQIIVEMCTEYISVEAIAGELGRSVDYLKNKILPGMIKKGLLIR